MNLRELQEAAGAVFSETGIPLSFPEDKDLGQKVAICDRSHWGIIEVTGEDRLRYLHNQSTNAFEQLQPGQGCDTVFVTSTARTLDLATVYVTQDKALILVSPERSQHLFAWLDKFIFPFDKVELKDISAEYAVFSLIGTGSNAILEQLSDGNLPEDHFGNHQTREIAGIPTRLAVGSGLATHGYTLIVKKEDGSNIWSKLTESGAIPVGDRWWETTRIQQGRPESGEELTEDYNPLEAGLWQTISFEKGCYIGQETIARLNTYNGIKQKLWGIKLSAPVTPGTPITLEDKKVGVLTSYTDTSTGSFGLGYIRTKAGGAGLQVQLGDVEGELVVVPFISHK